MSYKGFGSLKNDSVTQTEPIGFIFWDNGNTPIIGTFAADEQTCWQLAEDLFGSTQYALQADDGTVSRIRIERFE